MKQNLATGSLERAEALLNSIFNNSRDYVSFPAFRIDAMIKLQEDE